MGNDIDNIQIAGMSETLSRLQSALSEVSRSGTPSNIHLKTDGGARFLMSTELVKESIKESIEDLKSTINKLR